MKKLSRVVFLLAVSAVSASAQAPAHLKLAPEARQQIDGLVMESLSTWQERQACVGKWHWSDDTLVVDRIDKDPTFVYADSEHTFSRKHVRVNGNWAPIVCGDVNPIVHTHLPTRGQATGTPVPSETDWETLESRKLPFGLLITVMDRKTGLYVPGVYISGDKP